MVYLQGAESLQGVHVITDISRAEDARQGASGKDSVTRAKQAVVLFLQADAPRAVSRGIRNLGPGFSWL